MTNTHRPSLNAVKLNPRLLALQIILLVVALSFMGCASLPDPASLSGALPTSVTAKSEGLSADELGLLRILADELQEEERRGAYDAMYDNRASRSLRASLPRPHFLNMTRCLDRYLGELVNLPPGSLRIETLAKQTGTYALHYKVNRRFALVETTVSLIKQGFAFKLQGLQWKVLGNGSHAGFDTCMATALKGQPDLYTVAPPP